MRVGLVDVDGGRSGFPNLALMKLSAWHKANGDSVERKYYWHLYNTTKDDMLASLIAPSRSMSRYDTWEQALESGLKYALKELG